MRATSVASNRIISTRAAWTIWRLKNSRVQPMFSTAFAMKRPMIHQYVWLDGLSVRSWTSLLLASPLFQMIRTAIVVRMKIRFHAIGNAQFGGVRSGLRISAWYHSMPAPVKTLPRTATMIVINGMMM